MNHKSTHYLCLAASLFVLAACSEQSKAKETPKADDAAEQTDSDHPLANKPLRLFSDKTTGRWKSIEDVQQANARATKLQRDNAFQLENIALDPQQGKIFTLDEATAGIKGTGELKAHVKTTKGDITCVLDSKTTPFAAAHFVALARGLKTWWNPAVGRWGRTPFYSDSPVYNIVGQRAFMAGDPMGTGTTEIGVHTILLKPGDTPKQTKIAYPLALYLGDKSQQSVSGQIAIANDLPDFKNVPLYPIGSCAESYGVIQKIIHSPTTEKGFPIEEILIKEITFSR